jgi:periplasmic protein TonB
MKDLDVSGDVFSLDEVAQATGTSASTLRALIDSGRLPVVRGTTSGMTLVHGRDALAIGRWLLDHDEREPFGLSSVLQSGQRPDEPGRLARMSSAGVHVMAAGLLLWAGTPHVDATVEEPAVRTRLVFVVDPGAGSSGGGGTPSRPRPKTRTRPEPPAEAQPTPPPPPLETTSFAAPILSSMPATPSRVSTEEALDRTTRDATLADGVGPGKTGGIGDTQRSGIGEGTGPGEGGAGYGSGRGVSPPRLLREVKAVYSEDARRQGITGEVLLSIVIEADGRVGNVRVVRGLGAGLDERAVAAVREWQFAPARRLGTPVAVTVEVVVSFNLR